MNVEIGTMFVQFLFWEYLFRIFRIGSLQCSKPTQSLDIFSRQKVFKIIPFLRYLLGNQKASQGHARPTVNDDNCFPLYLLLVYYTVTRPSTGFRHPPDQTVRGGEHFFPRTCGYFTFPMPDSISGTFLRFILWKKERVWAWRILSCSPRQRIPCRRAQNMKY